MIARGKGLLFPRGFPVSVSFSKGEIFMTERIRSRAFMYVQQLEHLKNEESKHAIEAILTTLSPKSWAYIIHDKDKNNQTEIVKPHVHLVLEFENARSLSAIAKETDEPLQCFEVWKGNVRNAYSYLIHKTEDDRDKYQYDVSEVVSNFDYPKLIQDIENGIKNKKRIKDNELIDNLLNQIYVGSISIEEAEKQLSGSQYAKAISKIKAVAFKRQQNLSKEFIKVQKTDNQAKEIIWIFGEAGVGKTRLAKHYAQQYDKKYYISGSSRDAFQNYNNEEIVILDELRPGSFKYEDLLKMLDPYNFDVFVPSRYFDKALTTNIIIVTSPYSPRELYDELVTQKTKDGFEQLNRRIATCLRIDEKKISEVEYLEYKHISSAYQTHYFYQTTNSLSNPFYDEKKHIKTSTIFQDIKKLL